MDEINFLFNLSNVMKRGGVIGEMGGFLIGNIFFVCVDKDFNVGGFYYFFRCFFIESIGCFFFEWGDLGLGVFVMENGRLIKFFGIVFVKYMIN